MHIMQPGRLLPLYSSNTDTYAQSCCLLPVSSLETKENSRSTLQNHTWSIFSWKAPEGTPGGLIKTQSWRLVSLSFLDAKGQQSTRCSPSNVLCPTRRVEYSLKWPSEATELINSRVSRSLRIWNNAYYAIYDNYAHYSNYAYYAYYALQENKFTPGRVWVAHARRFGSYFQAEQANPGWYKNQNGTQTSIYPACQGAQTLFCTLHTLHICRAELIPKGLHNSPSYVPPLLPDDELAGCVSWPVLRYCIWCLHSPHLSRAHVDTNGLLWTDLTVQSEDWMSSSRHFHTHDHHHQFVLSSTKNILSELRTLCAFCIICTLRQLCSTDLEQLRNTERWPLSSGYVSSCSFALQGLDLSCLPVVLSNSYGPVQGLPHLCCQYLPSEQCLSQRT